MLFAPAANPGLYPASKMPSEGRHLSSELREVAMHVELHCPACDQWFSPSTAGESILEKLTIEGPWVALGDGETLEDRIYTALASRETIRCPSCGAPASSCEENLGLLSRQLLGEW
jgi:hypothetical protein